MPDLSTLVGKGFCSEVYAWGEGRVLKLFHASVAQSKIEYEFKATRAVRAAGVPAPAAYEMLAVEGRHGIVFERIDGRSLLEVSQKRPWTLFKVTRQIADLHAQIHRFDGPAELPTQRDWIAGKIEADGAFSQDQKQTLLRRLSEMPGGTALCHGDFHPENILITARGPVIIDWTSGTRGDPLGDVAFTARLMKLASLPKWTPGYMHFLLKCTRPLLYGCYIKRCLQNHAGMRKQIMAWEALIESAFPSPWAPE